ncbi:MAG: hypothetical protein WC868_05700 [Bacteroidales bacterium]
MNEKKHLNIDMEFLDKADEVSKAKSEKSPAAPEKITTPKVATTQNERLFAALGYFSFLFVIPLLLKRKSLYCKFHALQSMLLFFSSIVVLIALAVVPSLGSLLTLGLFGFYVVAIYRAYTGDLWKMPLIGNFTAKWSGHIVPVNPGKNSHVWKGLLIWAAVIAFFIWAGSLPDNKSSSSVNSNSSTYSNEDDDSNGQYYNCSSYNSRKSDELKPTFTKHELETESKSLEIRAEAIQQSATEIDNTHIDENDEVAVALFNAAVNAHNFKLEAYKRDAQLYDEKVNKFSLQVDAYNNYLQTNCTKRY